MKIKLLATIALAGVLACAPIFATPVTETTAVHTKPDAASPAFSYLKAGTEPAAAPSGLATTPAGWMAVEVAGPFQAYVEKKDMTKNLEVKPGTPLRLKPEATAPVLTVAERGDKSTITGLHGRWVQINVDKNLTGYIHVGGTADYVPPIATTPASSAVATSGPAASVAAPTPIQDTPAAALPGSPSGQPVTMAYAGDTSSTLPRQLTGKFVSTRSLLHPRRPFDWELDDNSGRRFAYLDVSKLLLTEQIDKYIGHFVVVFGAAKATADGKDIVIQVESLQLLMR